MGISSGCFVLFGGGAATRTAGRPMRRAKLCPRPGLAQA